MKKELKMLKESFNQIFCLLMLLFIPLMVKGQRSAEENYLRGIASFKQEMYDSALISFSLSKGLDEKNPRVWYFSGKSYFKKGLLEEAIADFLKAEELQTGLASYMLAKVYAKQNNLNKTLHFLEIHLRSNYKKPESTILLDSDLSRFENRKEWIEFWRNSRHYSNFDKLLAEAHYLAKNSDYTEAIHTLNQGIEKNYSEAPLLAKRAEIYILMENYNPALKDLNNAIDKDKRNGELYSLRGKVNYQLENYKHAEEDFSQALKLNPASLELYPQLAKSLGHLDRYSEAKENMQFYLQFFPGDSHAWYEYGRIHMGAGKYLDALRSLNRALDLNSSKSEYFLARGETYYNSRTYEYASRDFSMALDLDPRNADAYYLKGLTALKLNNKKMACYCFNKAYRYGSKDAFDQLQNCK
ncbi:MAG: tetratricopeptide repeat protein [Bacteroidota bacterium]